MTEEDVTSLDVVVEVVASPRATRAAVRPPVRQARDRFNTLPKVAIAFRNFVGQTKTRDDLAR